MGDNILDAFGGQSYPAIKWADVGLGGVVTGTLIGLPSKPVKDQASDKESFPLAIETSDGNRTLWVGAPSQLGAAIKAAVKEAGQNALSEGGKLSVKWDSEEDTGKPQKMRVFKAKYEAPAGGVDVDDIF